MCSPQSLGLPGFQRMARPGTCVVFASIIVYFTYLPYTPSEIARRWLAPIRNCACLPLRRFLCPSNGRKAPTL